MNDFMHFGDPARFEIAARWTPDTEPRERLPQDGGWSTGDLRITVGHQVLTARRYNGAECRHIAWYLAPLLDWLLSQWASILHEEAYAWPEKGGAPAAWTVFAALGRSIASSDETEQAQYRAVQAWWGRHALRAADPSALYPDLCLRRLGDDIEVSWAGRQPVYAPEGFTLTSPQDMHCSKSLRWPPPCGISWSGPCRRRQALPQWIVTPSAACASVSIN